MRQAIEGLLTEDDVARLLRKKASWLRYARSQGLIPFIKVGQAVRFRLADIERWLDRHRVAETDDLRDRPRSSSTRGRHG